MEHETDSRRTREDVIRYWTPRVVAIGLALAVGLAGFWSGGRETMSFLADWSTFCIQAGAIYLFVFEREFLANLVVDFLDFVRRMREYRERRAAARAAAQEAASRVKEQAAKPSERSTSASASQPTPAPKASPAVPASQAKQPIAEDHEQTNGAPLERPRFRSRDRALGLRVFLGLAFVALVVALLVGGLLPQRSQPSEDISVVAPPSDPPVPPTDVPITPQVVQPSTRIVADGESCWSIAASVAQTGERTESVWLRILAANPELCSMQRDQPLRPGSTLTIPTESQSAFE
jgi:hypothetical protein